MQTKRSIAVLSLVVVLAGGIAGCAADPAPAPLLPDSTAIRVLADLHLAAARQEMDGHHVPGLRDSVLMRHGLDSVAFAAAMAWYEARPSEYAAIYGAVIDRLNADRNP